MPCFAACLLELDRAVHDPVIGEPEGRLPELGRAGGELLDLARPVEQRVLGVDVEVGAGRGHRRLIQIRWPTGRRGGSPARLTRTVRASSTRETWSSGPTSPTSLTAGSPAAADSVWASASTGPLSAVATRPSGAARVTSGVSPVADLQVDDASLLVGVGDRETARRASTPASIIAAMSPSSVSGCARRPAARSAPRSSGSASRGAPPRPGRPRRPRTRATPRAQQPIPAADSR